MPSTRLPALTGIRAVAALSVCLTHAAFWTGNYTDDYPGRLFARCEVGVAIFFALSGYLLFTPWVRAARAGGPAPSALRYLWHRARRILPAYWITVLAVYVIYALVPPGGVGSVTGNGVSGLLRQLTLTQVYGIGHLHSGLTQMWSLAAEVAFYLALPPLGWVMWTTCRRRGAQAWRPDLLIAMLSALLLISPLWIIVVSGSAGISPTARLWAPSFLGWFVGGMLLAACAPFLGRLDPRVWVGTAAAALVVSATEIAGEPTITPTTASATIVKHVLYLVIALGLLAPLVGGAPSWWSRCLANRPMVVLGEISYELFCVHVIVLEFMMAALGYRVFTGNVVIAFLVTVAVSVPIAWMLHAALRVIAAPRPRPPGGSVPAGRMGRAESSTDHRNPAGGGHRAG
ncbi:MAG: acyltransferase [Gordonia sp. (in: high G+C Gram-positive bacteria)]